jgi:hypothetical protein
MFTVAIALRETPFLTIIPQPQKCSLPTATQLRSSPRSSIMSLFRTQVAYVARKASLLPIFCHAPLEPPQAPDNSHEHIESRRAIGIEPLQ